MSEAPVSSSSGPATTQRSSSLSLGPRSVERPADAGAVQIRVLDDPTPGSLDRAGAFAPHGAGFIVDWWIGADDRWHLPARETTVRQRRVGPGPVIETSVRIPSGDAVHRCYAVSSPAGSATVIEVHNASPVPVALAIAVRPHGLDGRGSGTTTMELDGDRIVVDGRTALSLPRRPNEAQAESDGDVVDRLLEGRAMTGPVSASGPDANLAVLYPLPHRTTLRFVVPGPTGHVPSHLPELEQVAKGWTSLIEANGRFVFPDAGIGDRADAARVRVLSASADLPTRTAALEPGAGRVLEALAVSGAHRECAFALGELAGIFPVRLDHAPQAAAAIVRGAAISAAMIGDRAAAETLLEPLMQITHLVERSGDRPAAATALAGLAGLLRFVGQDQAAADVVASVPHRADTDDLPADLAELTALLESASSVGSWGDDDVEPAARFWLGARRRLIDDRGDDLILLPDFPTAWRGGNVEVHGAATVFGSLSFAIRWHGARPALLWDLDAARPDDPFALTCPGLDPEWRTTERRGETLLAGVADELPPVPSEGDSFI